MGRISTSPRYVIDITGLDPLFPGVMGEGGEFDKIRKIKGIFNLRTGDWLLMKFYI